MGAGMEPPPNAHFANGRWTWAPMRALSELRLTQSRYVGDYVICWSKQCSLLSSLLSNRAELVVARSC
jgi:hypothetical protein